MKKLVTLISFSLFALISFGQHHCGMDEYYEDKILENPLLEKALQDHIDGFAERAARTNSSLGKKKAVQTIPVVFHVIHNYGPENISDAQIHDAVRVLNEDFRRLNSDASNTRSEFVSRAVDCEIEFRLAKKDPNGNCTSGITRTVSELTYGGDDDVTDLIKWDYRKYLNIWVIDRVDRNAEPPFRVLAFATLPGSFNSLGWDGVITSHDFVGTIERAAGNGNAGRTLTHEVGHWLGLLHPFYSRRGDNGCFEGDGMDDTPPVKEANYRCDKSTNSCTNDNPDLKDMIENYMDYADGVCQNAFTSDQKDEMIDNLTLGLRRINIQNSASTGINTNPTCKPVADFHVVDRNTIICQGSEIEFEDLSWNGEVTDRSWTFEGGTPSVSTFSNPKVKYSKAGTYKVTLKSSNSGGSSTKTKESFITVIAADGDYAAPVEEDVESSSVADEWSMGTEGIYGWKIDNGKGFLDSKAFKAWITDNTDENVKFSLISPTIDMRSTSGLSPKVSFRTAYSLRESNSGELLVVYASDDCGRSWKLLRGYAGATTLKSVDGYNPGWEPSQPSDWKSQSADITRNGLDTVSNLMLKFEVTSRSGNSVFIDDINVGLYNVGIDDPYSGVSNIYVSPNPSTGLVNVSFNNLSNSVEELLVIDIIGQTVMRVEIDSKETHVEKSIHFPDNGVYYLKLGSKNAYTVKKVIIAN